MKVAAYVRVSTHHQVDKDSLPFQRQELINYCKHVLNIPDYEIFEDAGYSAKNTDRPKFQEMMRRIREGEFTHILVWKLDRVSRNLRDFTEMWDELQRLRVTFVSKMEQFDTSSAMGAAMLQIILVFAELERKLTGERVMSIMLSRAEKGLWNGAPVPLGYDWDDEKKVIAVNEKEAETVRLIYDLYSQQGSSLDVLRYLEINDVETKRGGKWNTKTIIDVLRSPLYKGTLRYNFRESGRGRKKNPDEWILIDDAVPTIIPEDLWEQTQRKLDANRRSSCTNRQLARHTHLFTGLIYCPDCKTNFVCASDAPRKDGYRPSYYRCRNYAQSKEAWRECSGYASDVTLGPFILQYLANVAALHNNRNPLKPGQVEKMLLEGLPDVIGIESQGLTDICFGLIDGTKQMIVSTQDKTVDIAQERLKQGKLKYERALDRLESAYLFGDGQISEKDYLVKRGELRDKLQEITEQILSPSLTGDVDFIREASRFLLAQGILSGNMSFGTLVRSGDNAIFQTFLQSVIEQIEYKEKKVTSIRFVGGITHKFVYPSS